MNVKQKFALTLLTGVASGLTAGIAIHAQQVKPAPGYFVAGLEITVSFPKIPSDLNWHDEVESLHRHVRCLRSFMHSGCLSSIYSSRVVGLKPRTSFSVTS